MLPPRALGLAQLGAVAGLLGGGCAEATRPPSTDPPRASGTAPAPRPPSAALAPGDAAPGPVAASASTSGDVAAASPCPTDMVDVAVVCIDRYEAPNRAGEKPLRMQSLPEAEAWCRERQRRLCTEDEWQRACRGPEGWSYPYGPRYEEHACNQDKKYLVPKWSQLARWPTAEAKAEAERLDQSEPSGARPRCVSAEGVFDLTGNVAEWVIKQHPHPEACLDDAQRGHRHVLQGCYWGKCYREPHEPACGYVNCSHPAGFRSYEFGFRCCRDRSP